MKSNQKNISPPKDTPATRKRRLQDRLKELTLLGEQEMAAISQSLEKLRSSLKPPVSPVVSDKTSAVSGPEKV